MPEGHTIHRLAREHARWLAGHHVRVDSPQGRFAHAAAQLDGARLEATEAHGKHLFHHYEGARTVHVHLGLFGKVFAHRLPAPRPRATVRYRVTGPDRGIDLVGATTCELIGPAEVEAVVGRLGPDPIRRDADPERAFAALRRRRVPIGQALLDQRVVAGVGNVFRAEVLFVHGLHPSRPARELDPETWASVWSTLVTWLRAGVRRRRIVTVAPDELDIAWRRALAQGATYVYRREHCRRCGTPVRRFDLAGRWAYACEDCQPPSGRPTRRVRPST